MPIEIKQVPFSTLIHGTRPQDTSPNDVQAIRLYRIEEFEKYQSKKLIGSDIFTAESQALAKKEDVKITKPKPIQQNIKIIHPKEIRLYEEEWKQTVSASNDIASQAQLGLFAENRKMHTAEESVLWAVEDARHNKDKVKHELFVLEDLVIEQELQSGSRMDLSEKLSKLESDFDKRMIMRRRVDTFLTSIPGASVYSTSSSMSSPRSTNRATLRSHRSIVPAALHSPSQSSASSVSPGKKSSSTLGRATEDKIVSSQKPSENISPSTPSAPSVAASETASTKPLPALNLPTQDSPVASPEPASSSPVVSPIVIPKKPLPPKPSRATVVSPRAARLSSYVSSASQPDNASSRGTSADSEAPREEDDSHKLLQEEARRLSVNMSPSLSSKLQFAASIASSEVHPNVVMTKVPQKKQPREVQDFERTSTTKYFASPYKAVVRRQTVNTMINNDPITPHAYSSSLHHISNNKREAKRLEEQYLLSKKISTVGMTEEQLREMRRYDRQQKRKFGIPLDHELRREDECMKTKQENVVASTIQKRKEIIESHHVFDKTKYDGVINGIHMARKQEIMRDIMQRHRNKDLCGQEQVQTSAANVPVTKDVVTVANLFSSSATSCSLPSGEPTITLLGDARQSESYFREVQHRVRKMRQSEEVDLLLGKCRWLISIVTMLKKQEKKVITPTPQSCYMFLAILKRFLLLNFNYTKEIFFTILESCVPPSDHSIPIVHETLQLLRDKVSIGPIEFHDYLLKNNIQPCTMLLKQVREARKRLQRRNKILAMAVFSKRVKPTVRTVARLSVNQPQRLSLLRASAPRSSIKKNIPRLSIRAADPTSDVSDEPQVTPRPKSLSHSFVVIQSSRSGSSTQENIQSIVIEDEDDEDVEEEDEHVFSDDEVENSALSEHIEETGTPWGDIGTGAEKKPIILPRTTSVALGSTPYFRGTSLEFIDEAENEDY